ncbi:MAG: gamma-glutamyltransferase, partial [Acidobacteriales bacterium]|nr:gamma-glutamyltransferase [Terriglobales bacterium]
LRRIATKGAREFYEGETAAEICRYAEQQGGLLSSTDLRAHSSAWEAPIGRPYLGHEVFVSPPNSIGLLLLAQLALLEKAVTSLEMDSSAYVDALIKAKRAAFRSVLPLLADPESMTHTVDSLLSPDFLQPVVPANEYRMGMREVSDTTSISVVDAEGNCISLIQSIFYHFGCGAIAGNTGVLLNNRMLGFSSDGSSPNRLQGAKRPAHTLSPCLVLKGGLPCLVISTPGAYGQTQTLCQVLNKILVFGIGVQYAIDEPRWFDTLEEATVIESRFPGVTLDGLKALGYSLRLTGDWEPLVGNPQAVLIDHSDGEPVLLGGADQRRHGCALGN